MNDADSTAQRGRPWVHAFLALILGLLALQVFIFFRYGDPSRSESYGNFVVPLALLFNHLAFHYTRTGWQSKVMKVVAWVWLVIGTIYIFWAR